MKRRDFIKKAGLTASAAFAAPYILPSGRLFAASGLRKADHVVVCLYAGGVRSWESHKFANGQYGNMMPYTCLLYTSPSPRDLSTSRMPSSA